MEQNLSRRRAEQGSLAPLVGVALGALTISSLVLFSVIAQKASREGFSGRGVTAQAPSQEATRTISLAPATPPGGDNIRPTETVDNATQLILATDAAPASATGGQTASSDAATALGGSSSEPADSLLVLLDRSPAEALDSLDASAQLLALADEAELLDVSAAELLALADEAELVDASAVELLALAEDAELLDVTGAELHALAEEAELLDASGDDPELETAAARPEDVMRPFASEGSSRDVGDRDGSSDDRKKARGSKKGDGSKNAKRSANAKRSSNAKRSNHRNGRGAGRSHGAAHRSNRAAASDARSRPAASNQARPAAKPAQPASKPARPAKPAKASSKAKSPSSEPKRHSHKKAASKRKR